MVGNVLQQIVGWLRAGYPQGVPREDYLALYAVLHRRLTDTEIAQVAEELAASTPGSSIGRADIAAAIARMAKQKPSDEDIARVASRLAVGGWPLAGPNAGGKT